MREESQLEQSPSDVQSEPVLVTLREYWGGLVRRKWLVIVSILAGTMIGVVLCLVLPKSYRSSTVILIESQKIPDEYVKGIGGGKIEERLMMIQQQVMSRGLLSQILSDYKLYEGVVKRDGLETAIERLRKAIKVDTVGTIGPRGKTSIEAVTISFANEDPMVAMKVTEKLAALYIDENLKDREQIVSGVSTFLEQELQEAKKALEAQEKIIGEYKTKYIGLLPEQMDANLRTLDRLQSERNATNDALQGRVDKLSSLERSINDYQLSEAARVESDDQRSIRKDVDPRLVRLRELEQRLTTLRAEWKETYPDILDAQQEILSLKEQLGEKYGAAYLERDAEVVVRREPRLDLYLRELDMQRNDLVGEIASLKARRSRLDELIKETERRVEQTPVREQELTILVRDYENRQKNYQTLLDKQLNAHVAGNLEKRQKGEQFRILDPANLPEKLDSPNRVLIMVVGFLGGGGLGVGLAIGLDRLNPTFRRREELELLSGIRVLATVPQFLPVPSEDTFELGNRFQANLHSAMKSETGSDLVAKWRPRSLAADQYRMAATRIALSTERRRSTLIEVTSALEGEGKTTTVVNLGYTIARDLEKKTLLLECDFRRPALQRYVREPVQFGLLDLLDGGASVDECLVNFDEVPCSIMTLGRSREGLNELVRIDQLRKILPQLRAQFQYILLNTPPVLASASMGVLASLADEIVLVIRAGSSPKHVVQKAFAMLDLTGERQVVLNRVDEQSLPHYLYGYSMSYHEEPVLADVPK